MIYTLLNNSYNRKMYDINQTEYYVGIKKLFQMDFFGNRLKAFGWKSFFFFVSIFLNNTYVTTGSVINPIIAPNSIVWLLQRWS